MKKKNSVLLSQNLELVNNHENIIKELDIRNAILFYIVDFIHKNCDIENQIRILKNLSIQNFIEKMMAILLDKTIQNKVQLQNKILEIFMEDDEILELKIQIHNVLKFNDNFELKDEITYYNGLLKDKKEYCEIYKKSKGKCSGSIYFKKIAGSDLINDSELRFTLSNQYFKLFLIKTMGNYCEMYLTQIACILHGHQYFIGITSDEKEIILELIPNAIDSSLNNTNFIISILNIPVATIVQALVINSILNTPSEKFDNTCQTTRHQIIPIDFSSSTQNRTILKNVQRLRREKPERLKNIKRINKRLKLVINFINNSAYYNELISNFNRSLHYIFITSNKYLAADIMEKDTTMALPNIFDNLSKDELRTIILEQLNPSKIEQIKLIANDMEKNFINKEKKIISVVLQNIDKLCRLIKI